MSQNYVACDRKGQFDTVFLYCSQTEFAIDCQTMKTKDLAIFTTAGTLNEN